MHRRYRIGHRPQRADAAPDSHNPASLNTSDLAMPAGLEFKIVR